MKTQAEVDTASLTNNLQAAIEHLYTSSTKLRAWTAFYQKNE